MYGRTELNALLAYFLNTAFSVNGGGVNYPPNYTNAVVSAVGAMDNSVGVLFDDFIFDTSHLALHLPGAAIHSRDCGDEFEIAELVSSGALVGTIRNPGHLASVTSTDGGSTWSAPVNVDSVAAASCQVSVLGLGPNYFWQNLTISTNPGPNNGSATGWHSPPALDPADPAMYGDNSPMANLSAASSWGHPLGVVPRQHLPCICKKWLCNEQ